MLRTLIAVVVGLVWSTAALADGLIIIPHPPVGMPSPTPYAPLEVTYHRVSVAITDQAAVTTVDQEFFNPTGMRLEGTYIFPLPAGAHIDKFAMDINGTMAEAELLPADKARSIYEDIVRRMKDPALLEYMGRDAFKVRIFPIEPNSRKKITIKYTQLIKADAGLLEYSYPLNTEKFSAKPVGDVSVKVQIDTTRPLKSVYCPSHAAEVKRDGEKRAVVGWEEKNVKPDTDFKVVFSTASDPVGIDVLTYRTGLGDEGSFLLLASPGALQSSVRQPKDIVFAIDTSGSMANGKLDQAKKALKFCLDNLNKNDRFEIVRFSTEAEGLFGKVVPADLEHLQHAEAFVDSLKPIGGTAIADALDKSLAAVAEKDDRPAYVLFMTDGLPTVGQTNEDAILKAIGKDRTRAARIFVLGVGTDVNTNLLDRLAGQTKAASQYVLPKEDLELKLSCLYMKIRDPVLTNLSLSVDGGVRFSQTYPKDMPDLFNGDMLVVFGRYSGKGPAKVTISGTLAGDKREFACDVNFAETATQNDYIPRLWASRRVGWLLDEIRLHGESAELKDEVTRLARQYGIVTPYTAYLILEDEARRNVPADARSFGDLGRNREEMDGVRRAYDSAKAEGAAAPSSAARSGEQAVENSMRMQSLKDNNTIVGTKQGRDSFSMPSSAGAAPAMVAAPTGVPSEGKVASRPDALSQQQLRVVNNRAFYQNGNRWVDSHSQTQQNLKQKQVKFGSDEYFALVRTNADMAAAMALGNEVDVVIGDTLYQVR